MIAIEMKQINKEDITPDVLFNIAQEILKDCNPERAKEVEETLHQSPSIEEMKESVEIYQEIIHTLVEKIKEEEDRRKQDTHHLITKKIRTTTIDDTIISQEVRNGFTPKLKHMSSDETFTYIREWNKVICTIDTPKGKFEGVAALNPVGEFDYESGMILAMLRARKEQYTQLEKDFVKN